jgi:hypothetical protein
MAVAGCKQLCVACLAIFVALPSLAATTAAARDVTAPDDEPEASVTEVDFDRHVASLFGRLGCNAASCHGSFQGKGGFRLSLFGQSPEFDFAAVDDGRIDRDSPDESLLLVKPSGREKHGGGIRFRQNSWEYRLIRRWIAGGARRTGARGRVQSLTVEPGQLSPLTIGQTARIRVEASFASGDQEDVTAFTEFRSLDESVAETNPAGGITARGAGDTSIVISYRGQFASAAIIVPFSGGQRGTKHAAGNLIDREIDAKLEKLNLAASPSVTDEEFLRRVTLDVLGILPSPAEILQFVDDPDPHKRVKLIDSFLVHPRRAALWATRMCDITGASIDTLEMPEALRPKRAKMWHDWFRRRFERNEPYDQIVRGVLCATSRDGQTIDAWIDDQVAGLITAEKSFSSDYAARDSLDLFWRRSGPQGQPAVEDIAELVATAFLGVRLHCARCHQHPYDRWTQQDFAAFAKVLSRVEFGASTELRTAMIERLEQRRQARRDGSKPPELPRLQEVFIANTPRRLDDAASAGSVAARALGGPEVADTGDPRLALHDWLVRPDNPFFARSFVNRVWAKYFGVGLYEPTDALSAANPPTHPQLLDRLAMEFVNSGYDVAQLERLILSSEAYQRSSRPNGNNAADQRNFSHARVRPLLAEALVDSINAALEASDNFGPDVPPGTQAIELAPSRFSEPAVNALFSILGRGSRKSACDCERASTPSLRQSLYLMSDARILSKVRGGRLARLLTENRPDEAIVEELYLATLSRRPDADEREFSLDHIASSNDRAEALTDIAWALVNTREFVTNH